MIGKPELVPHHDQLAQILLAKVLILIIGLIGQPATVCSQQSNARWTIARNSNITGTFEQRWGQARRLQHELATTTMATTLPTEVPKSVELRGWHHNRNGTNRNFGVPNLVVARGEGDKDKDRMEEMDDAKRMKPAEAEEDAEEEEITSSQDRKVILTPQLFDALGPKNTTATTSPKTSQPQPLFAAIPAPMPDPVKLFGSSSATDPSPLVLPPAPSLDLRQLPNLMLLFKELPTMFNAFNGGAIPSGGNGGGTLLQPWDALPKSQGQFSPSPPVSPSNSGLIHQLFGSAPAPIASGTPLFPLQSQAVKAEKGYGSGGGGEEYRIPSQDKNSENGPIFDVIGTKLRIAPITPIVTTHGIQQKKNANDSTTKHPQSANNTVANGENIGRKVPLAMSDRQRTQRLNIYGVPKSATLEAYTAPSVPKSVKDLGKSKKTTVWTTTTPSTAPTRRPRPEFDIERLTVGELGQLEKIHRKLFSKEEKEEEEVEDGWRGSAGDGPAAGQARGVEDQSHFSTSSSSDHHPSSVASSSPPTMPSPRQIPSSASFGQKQLDPNSNLKALISKGVEVGHLDQAMLNELLAVGELPDLEELTQGMDLGLLNKPGGFAILKQQFIERILQRTMMNPG